MTVEDHMVEEAVGEDVGTNFHVVVAGVEVVGEVDEYDVVSIITQS
eukprot:CAMPEP_0197832598 /NCGR_PEP_ID=MMETSP1437-20131217/15299_1 /TAXON_ID=49252 ORGANISM="Eucampia antarctica, Strain CCMP1452" /NCGR_SAMPLE_ID=MMETSP1437 /ASSEMBLY_ACC=CAM_ASM_001096 /LENGTH=45 /DNA_ID= /DNA_START= /DNA_END= /DNA_ORIENTATION=